MEERWFLFFMKMNEIIDAVNSLTEPKTFQANSNFIGDRYPGAILKSESEAEIKAEERRRILNEILLEVGENEEELENGSEFMTPRDYRREGRNYQRNEFRAIINSKK